MIHDRSRSALLCLLCLAALRAGAHDVDAFTEPNRYIDIASPESGILARMAVEEGADVQQGQVLAALDNRYLEASLQIAKAKQSATSELEVAEADLARKRERLARLEELLRADNAHPDEVQEARSEVRIARARVEGAREDLAVQKLESERIRTRIQQRTMVSPIDGVVVAISKDEGELVTTSTQSVLRIADLDPLKVKAHVPWGIATSLRSDQEVTVAFTGQDASRPGTVQFVSPVVEPQSGTVRVDVLVANESGALRSGVPVRVHFDDPVAGSRE